MGLIMGLQDLRKLGASNVIVEGDSKVVISWGLSSSKGYWKYTHFIHEIREIVTSLNVSLIHVPRSQNALADNVAKWAWVLRTFISLM